MPALRSAAFILLNGRLRRKPFLPANYHPGIEFPMAIVFGDTAQKFLQRPFVTSDGPDYNLLSLQKD
ncbi:MAG: hypothetical protein ACT4QE_22105 [Anaerolineales bacterium]